MADVFGDTDWRAMTQQQRDLGLNNGVAVADSAALVAGWDQRSALMRARHGATLDRRYGPKERNRFDFMKAAQDGPTLVFIHGGYWQTRAKESFACFATGPMAHGINVALVGYTLAPDATLDQIVEEIYASVDALAAQLPALGGDPARVVLTGWSAGGHLTVSALSHPLVKAGMPISGVYDLQPIRHSYLNAKLGLDEAAARRHSPLAQPGGAAKPLSMVVGSAELPLLRRQTADMAAHRARQGLPVTYEEIPGANHFTILDELEQPGGRITTLIRQLFVRIAA
jgi:acetyl esterase/lipase